MERGAVLALLLVSCGTVQEAELVPMSPKEEWALSETARFSGVAGQRVRGALAGYCYSNNCESYGAAWYIGQIGRGSEGIAWFVRDWVNANDPTNISWAAAHEVCHSITGFAHDDRHKWCNQILYYGWNPYD